MSGHNPQSKKARVPQYWAPIKALGSVLIADLVVVDVSTQNPNVFYEKNFG